MTNPADLKKLAMALEAFVATLVDVVESRVRESARTQTSDPIPRIQEPTSQPWINKRQAAEHCHVSVRTIDNWISKGVIPCVRIGRSLRFRACDLDEALMRRCRRARTY